MQRYHRIVWNEGLFLTPHHLQQWDLYQESELVERLALTRPFAWGLHSVEFDREDLARGVFRILRARGLFPSGSSFRVPEIDPPPPSLPFKDVFDIKQETMDVFLGLPARRSGWPSTTLPGAGDEAETRYVAKPAIVADDNTGRNERTIQRAEARLRLLLSSDPRDNYDSLPIARVTRSSAGGYSLVEGYVPPLLSIHASPWLSGMTRSLLERLTARSSELASRFADAGADARDITPANLRAFLQFSIVNRAIPMMAHHKDLEGSHPETLYRTLAELAGGLSTFNPQRVHPRDVPRYNHDTLGETFAALERLVVDLLELQVSQGYIVIPLVAAGEGRLHAMFSKDSLLEPTASLILAASSEQVGEREILAYAPKLILASLDRIQVKINNKIPGLPIHHMPVPPPAIPRRRGTIYFQLENRGADWDAIRASRNMALDVPLEYRNVQLELLGLEGGR